MTARLRPLMVGLAAACTLGVTPILAHAEPAAPSTQTADLCSGPVPCSVQVDPTWAEGASREVAVTGRPDVTVGVRAFRVETTARGGNLLAFGPVIEVTTDDHGFGRADLELPALGDDESAGPLLIAVEDSVGPDLSVVLGAWTTLASRSPLLLGDGYATAKPVGVELILQVTAAIPGTTYDVEIERNGQWESIGTGDEACQEAAAPCDVGYEIPRGLEPSRHAARLVDTASGTPVATWRILPTDEGMPAERDPLPPTPAVATAVPGTVSGSSSAVPAPRSQGLDAPDIAAEVEGAATGEVESHAVATVRRVALGLVGAAALLALLAVARGTTRGRVVRRG